MEDRHITGSRPTRDAHGSRYAHPDAIPSEPPRYALHDDMRMPDRLLRFDKLRSGDCMRVCATVDGDEQELEDFHAEHPVAAAQGKP